MYFSLGLSRLLFNSCSTNHLADNFEAHELFEDQFGLQKLVDVSHYLDKLPDTLAFNG